MKKVVIAVDDTKGSKAVLATLLNLIQRPEEIVLLHVLRLEGRSLMTDMLGEAEMSTLRDSLKDTEHREELDKKAVKILSHYKKEINNMGLSNIKTVARDGIPSDEILKVANEENAELIIMGYSGRKGLNRLIAGSVARDVEKKSKVPVLVARKPTMCEEAYTWKDAYYAVSLSTVIMLAMFFLGIIVEKIFLP